jgi:putative transposase
MIYRERLAKSGIRPSCSRKGNPYDNAHMERFMRTLKQEKVYLRQYETIEDLLESLPHFIEEVYNKKRVHSALDYLTPEEFELKNIRN